MPTYAKALTAALAERDPGNKPNYDRRLQTFLASLHPLDAKIAELRSKFAGSPVTATEPVFGYMATALGFKLPACCDEQYRAAHFGCCRLRERPQEAPSAFALLQQSGERSRGTAVGANRAADANTGRRVTETEPADTTFQNWMTGELNRSPTH
jgi:zinc/manganese transport system substrate-binding protein